MATRLTMDTVDDQSINMMTSTIDDALTTVCDEYIANMTSLVRLALQTAVYIRRPGNETAAVPDGSPNGHFRSSHRVISFESLMTDVLAPIVCVFGVIGNLLNLFVLTRRRVRRSMDGLERSVRIGLVALAVSDELFCIVYLVAVCFRPTSAKHLYSPYDNLATLYLSVRLLVRLSVTIRVNINAVPVCLSRGLRSILSCAMILDRSVHCRINVFI